MKIAVLSGSPKGKLSVSLQSVNYIKKYFPDHEYEIFHISQAIQKLESDTQKMDRIINSIEKASLVVWVTPVYYFTVPSQYKRFIEYIFNNDCKEIFKKKFSAVITTSINFFDNIAHEYMRGICDDLDMKFAGSFSAESDDLLIEKERTRLLSFAEDVFNNVLSNSFSPRAFHPVIVYDHSFTASGKPQKKINNRKIKMCLIQDRDYSGTNLGNMIENFKGMFEKKPESVNLTEIDIKGGCLGCVQCAFDHKCVYEKKDDFVNFYKSKILASDILIFAGEIKDRFLSAKFKEYFDRTFFNSHTPVLAGKQIGLITSGPYSQLHSLKTIINSYSEIQRANFAGFVSDEEKDNSIIEKSIQSLGERLVRYHEKKYIKPATFLGIGGHKIFRDDTWGKHRFVFQADHKFYEENGLYDFPQNDERAKKTNQTMMELTENPEMREAIRKELKTGMVSHHLKVVKEK